MDFPIDTVNANADTLAVTPSALRAAIDAAGIQTQVEAASALGVSTGAVSLWLNGKRPIPPMATMALASIKAQRRPSKTPRQPRIGRSRKDRKNKG